MTSLINRHPNPGDERLRQIIDKLTVILNSLLRSEILVQTDDQTWTIDPEAIPGLDTIINTLGRGGGTGRTGPRGRDGNRWLTGRLPPHPLQGMPDDFFFQAQGGLVWHKRQDGLAQVWRVIAKLPSAGPQGPRGLEGRPGRPGKPGPPGADGIGGVDETAWTTYTPAWTGSSGNPAIGNGTLQGAFKAIGKTLHLRIDVAMGSTTTFGTGHWEFGLPAGFVVKTGSLQTMVAMAQDIGTAMNGGLCFLNGGATSFPIGTFTGGVLWFSAAPHTWANTDIIRINGSFEVN